MSKHIQIFEYPAKILIAMTEAMDGNRLIHKWLFDNGYPEIGFFVSALQQDIRAFEWLMKHGYPEYAALCNAIDNDEKAKEWLIANKFTFLLILLDCVEKKQGAMDWLKKNNLPIFTMFIHKLLKLKDYQIKTAAFPYKIHFN